VIEVSTELVVDGVESKRVDGWVNECETEACRLEHMQVGVVADIREMPDEQVHVTW